MERCDDEGSGRDRTEQLLPLGDTVDFLDGRHFGGDEMDVSGFRSDKREKEPVGSESK